MASVSQLQEEMRRLVGFSAPQPQRSAGERLSAPEAAPAQEALQIANPQSGTAGAIFSEFAVLRQQVGAVRESLERQGSALEANARSITEAVQAASAGPDVLRGLREFAGGARAGSGGLSLVASPLVGLLGRLFSRRSAADPQEPPPRFALPEPVSVDAALPVDGGRLAPVDYNAGGVPRRVERPVAAPAITVQVQTMDSRSFLDNSDQIARAVREAMLNSHSLNDVVGEM